METEKPIILFDGVCNFCNSSVDFVIARDPKGIFRLGALQSEEAKPYLEKYEIDPDDLSSMALIEDGKHYRRSTAALRIARRLKQPWPLLYVLIVIPPFVRDFVYNWIAKNRYKWFGKMESCRMPTDELRERFLS
ncbi:MAG: thiol-disulfide oxidoreductase DCC family protein [Candidatus Omnitrophica bacterium]|nr:thiol-disulfide oxidoreductase DCC family protein [Candidatus Omnitrophota bacterium]